MRLKQRILLSVALGALLAAPLTMTLAASGRDYPRCVNACNVARQACSSRCPVDCNALYPNDVAARNACNNQCKAVCVDQEQDCKDRCLAIKKGVSPSEP